MEELKLKMQPPPEHGIQFILSEKGVSMCPKCGQWAVIDVHFTVQKEEGNPLLMGQWTVAKKGERCLWCEYRRFV